MKDMTQIKITIPDAPVEEQVEMIEGVRDTLKSLADVLGEPFDTTEFDNQINKLQNPPNTK